MGKDLVKNWDAGTLGERLASASATNSVLEALVQHHQGPISRHRASCAWLTSWLTSSQAQAGRFRKAEEAEDGDRNKYSKSDIRYDAIEGSLALRCCPRPAEGDPPTHVQSKNAEAKGGCYVMHESLELSRKKNKILSDDFFL